MVDAIQAAVVSLLNRQIMGPDARVTLEITGTHVVTTGAGGSL